MVYFPSYTPENDLCKADGSSRLYALFYKTGTGNPYRTPLGTDKEGTNVNVKKSMNPGLGQTSEVAVHLGGRGFGGLQNTGASPSGTSLVAQKSTGGIIKIAIDSFTPLSRILTWLDRRI